MNFCLPSFGQRNGSVAILSWLKQHSVEIIFDVCACSCVAQSIQTHATRELRSRLSAKITDGGRNLKLGGEIL